MIIFAGTESPMNSSGFTCCPSIADEFADTFEEMENNGKDAPQKGCVFTKRNPEGPGFVCIIYPDRPTICKEFLCYRMLINDTHNRRAPG